jgi:zinc metalloprotease ZmpB
MALQQIVSLTYSKESGAMNEGQADYFACSYTNDPILGEWVMAKLNKPYMRILTNDLQYPQDITGEVHADGRIWGAILWDIRTALGAEVADLLIHKSFYYLKSGSPKFIDGYNALVVADKNVFDGANAEALAEVMKKRGVIASSYKGTVLDKSDIQRIKAFREAHEE